jgi:ABC-2 type transport system ATP-binding protein
MIRFENLVFDYPGHRALHGVSGQIDPGSITALVGPNGAGKTTLMRCMAALDTPFSGSIHLGDLDVIAEPRRTRARLGFLQDLFGLYDELSARRCLHYAAATRGVPEQEIGARIDAVAARVGIAPLLDHLAGALSRGQRQRLAIGQTIIHSPALLILDEPAAGLDPESRAELSALLRTLRDDGMTLIVSSHILAELEDYSTHLLVLEGGRIAQHSAIATVRPMARRLTATMAGSSSQAKALLRQRAEVSALGIAGNTLTFEFSGDDAAQAALLAALINDGIRVVSFSETRASLEELYLDRIRSVRAARA